MSKPQPQPDQEIPLRQPYGRDDSQMLFDDAEAMKHSNKEFPKSLTRVWSKPRVIVQSMYHIPYIHHIDPYPSHPYEADIDMDANNPEQM